MRVFKGDNGTKESCVKRFMVHQSVNCQSFHIQPVGAVLNQGTGYGSAIVTAPSVCPETGGDMKIGGPYWGGALYDRAVLSR